MSHLQDTAEYLEEVIDLISGIDSVYQKYLSQKMYWADVPDYMEELFEYRRIFDKFEEFKDGYPEPERLEELLHKAFAKDEQKKEKYNLTGRYIDTSEMFYTQNVVGTLNDACKVMVEAILNEMGNGDGENGGKGSLLNCYGEIWDALKKSDDHAYDYGNCHFYITKI